MADPVCLISATASAQAPPRHVNIAGAVAGGSTVETLRYVSMCTLKGIKSEAAAVRAWHILLCRHLDVK